jgi:hypothetical protein
LPSEEKSHRRRERKESGGSKAPMSMISIYRPEFLTFPLPHVGLPNDRFEFNKKKKKTIKK